MKILIWVAAIVAALSVLISLILYISAVRQSSQEEAGTEETL